MFMSDDSPASPSPESLKALNEKHPAASSTLSDLPAPQPIEHCISVDDKKLSYRRGTTRCVVSIEILPIATQQCRNYLYDKS